jgi:hypothetical protein
VWVCGACRRERCAAQERNSGSWSTRPPRAVSAKDQPYTVRPAGQRATGKGEHYTQMERERERKKERERLNLGVSALLRT